MGTSFVGLTITAVFFPPVGGRPVECLPAHVAAPARQLTVFADFDRPRDGGVWVPSDAYTPHGCTVPVYVVNRTAGPIRLTSQDGDLYLKLEYESAPGRWVRAQPHRYSWCGNSYWARTLEAGRFIVIQGVRLTEGVKAKVRYRFYGQKDVAVASNAGDGRVDVRWVDEAANDAMTVRTGDFAFVRKVAVGETKLTGVSSFRHDALMRLYQGPFPRREVEAALAAVANDPDGRLAGVAQGLLASVRKDRGVLKE